MSKDPLVLYIVVRQSLNMDNGEIAIQVGHIVEKFLLKYFKIQICSSKKELMQFNILSNEDLKHAKETTEWIEHSSLKIVLSADDQSWSDIKKEYGKELFIIKDNFNSETALCFWPEHTSQISNMIKSLPAVH